jgi:uroporphyrinogen-III synthase
VGPRTAAVAAEAGLSTIEAGPDAENLVARLTREAPTGPLLHLRGEHIRGDIASRLRLAGLEVQDAVAYRQEPLSPTVEARVALDGDDPLVAPLFSSRSAVLLSAWTPAAPLHVIALSAAVALAARPLHPASLEVASLPRGEAMVEMTLRALAACDRTAT